METTRKPGQGENHKDEGKQRRDQEKREEAANEGKDWPQTSPAERAANPTPAYVRLHLHVGKHSGSADQVDGVNEDLCQDGPYPCISTSVHNPIMHRLPAQKELHKPGAYFSANILVMSHDPVAP